MKFARIILTILAVMVGLLSVPSIASASSDRTVKVDDNATLYGPLGQGETLSWALDRVDSHARTYDALYNPFWGYAKNTVKAYVIDSGVRATHAELAGKVLPGYDFVENDSNPQDCLGHGTHVAGLIAGTQFGSAGGIPVKIVPLRVFDCEGVGTEAAIAGALDWILANGTRPGVVNMSLTFVGGDSYIDVKVQALINAGFTVVAAAGNQSGDACAHTPGRVPGVITVANSMANDVRSSTSNWGTCVDLFAPGTSVPSACYGSDVSICQKTGTSMSSPIVAGAAALYLKLNPTATSAQFSHWLTFLASPSGHTKNVITDAGVGTPNKLLYVGG